MSEPIFHHYVPRFYLARFANKDRALWVYDKSQDRVFSTGPERIAGENEFYEVPELAELGLSTLYLEKQFADLESEASKITECWLNQVENDKAIDIPAVNREIVSLFLALQLLRTNEARTQIVQFHKAIQILQGQEPSLGKSDPNYLHTSLLWDEELVNKIAQKIARCNWIFAWNKTSKGFYTSDHPVLAKSSDNKNWIQGPRVFDPGTSLIYPLSPTWILYCEDREQLKRFDRTVSPVEFTEDMVDHENSGQVGMSYRFVFAHEPDFEFARMFCDLEKQIKDPQRERYEWNC
ncbi:MAG: DUF4238 domain-containing protein [Acidobacteriota bacterium]